MRPRETIVAAAREWVGTPYHHRAMVKGAGCDCLMLIVAAYTAAGLLPAGLDVPDYPPDIMFHKDDHSYLHAVLDRCDEVVQPQAGDIVMWQFGRTFSHAGLVTGWPRFIHAYAQYGAVLEMDINDDNRLLKRPVRFFSPKGLS